MPAQPQPARPGYGQGRTALLDAAIRVVARDGLRGLTYRAVAAEAGVTHGLVTRHFGSRAAMIEEALGHAVEHSLAASSLESDSGRIDEFAHDLPRMAEDDADGQAFQFELILEARRRPELRDAVRGLYTTYRAATRRELRRIGLDADDGLTRAVFAALDSMVFQQITFGRPEDTEAGLAALRRMLSALRDRQQVRQRDSPT
ncbi:MAG TPA: TetR family transcriptional regulator [Solirubrobacteraceae bacterium]|nr:TetR family transcriptional regulator [Solirubrobacteraceae bacterium]